MLEVKFFGKFDTVFDLSFSDVDPVFQPVWRCVVEDHEQWRIEQRLIFLETFILE